MELLNHLATLLIAYMKPLLLKQSCWQRKVLTPVLFVFVTAVLLELLRQYGGRDGSVATATCYSLDGPRFSGPSRLNPKRTQLTVQYVPALLPRRKAAGAWG